MGRLKFYVAGSAIMANIVLARAYCERPNFYSAAVYISQSTGSLMFLVNLMLIVAASFGYGLQRLFYGPLRPIETEQLYDKAWFAVSETLLAMTIFRDDIGLWFFTMFLCLLAGKVWQWIGEGRVEFLEQQPPANPRLFHTRLASSLLLSVFFDVFMTQYCVSSILSAARPGVMVMFGFEYVLLAIASMSTLMRYGLSLVELAITQRQEKARDEARTIAREQARQQGADAPAEVEDEDDDADVPGWEEKGRWVFYLDLATDFVKASVYLGFFTVLMTFYGIPIHIMRDLFMSVRSLIKRINDFIQYRNATRDMNTRYPDATGDDLSRENICIVCREEMRPWNPPGAEEAQPGRRVDERQRPKKLPCGHILHFSCLRSWLERQQVCPTCRRPVLGEATAQPAQPNNPANPAAQNQQDQANAPFQGGLRGFFPGNAQPPAPNQAQPGAPPQGAQPNRPAGNMRVFNFGPFRIALGNLRLPAEQAGNANNVRNAIDQLRQQAVAGQAPQAPVEWQQGQVPSQPMLSNAAPNVAMDQMGAALAQQPVDIRYDILRIQQHIIQQLRQLNVQSEQLEVSSRLLVELNRLNAMSVAGQQTNAAAPLDAQNASAFAPQAYFARGQALRQGDIGVPQGLTLPEGWSLRPMALAAQSGQESTPLPSQSAASVPTAATAATAIPEAQPTPVVTPTVHQAQADSAPTQAAPTTSSDPAVPATASSPKPAAPSSLGSSWSFGDIPERSEPEGSSSAVAGSSSEGHVTKRAVTVEDAEDNEQ
ncbi:RING finger domain-containing protein [Boeremia exigua]|uniref:RING finger domain-containing protein n=1 Tax=Boeremia exigua TaxID=749465 RepID=UPI001E8D85F5|nr:RING finger domain-containing protein [Boeremia exigua]KAH6637715.1 RING finger domain-containing protein [Boeremia exigua]